jgi:molecular chaperone GrpE
MEEMDGRDEEKESAMPPNKHGQHEHVVLPQKDKQPKQEDKSDSTTAPTTPVEVESLLAVEQQKVEECIDQLKRTQADFVNYRRRIGQEQAQGRTTAQIVLLSHLLPALDDFERALVAVPSELSMHPWVQGLFLVARRLSTQLDQLGVQQIGASGELFDPRRHEAISTEVRTDLPEGTIVQIVQPGYVLADRIIRPAQVVVAVPPNDVPAEPEDP